MNTTAGKRKLQNALLKWFGTARREMPWRETADPYAIWVSEIMLQQTQVATVIPYFERWMRSFPTVHKLARAREDTVLKHWEGLGYYSRARNLHRTAKTVVRDHGGRLPDSHDALMQLPGIGRYTAGAILSIAFGQAVPVLDGNVKRVLSRLFTVSGNGRPGTAETRLWDLSSQLVPDKNPGDFNQALMELGATVCLPKKPMCLLCPVQSSCQAYRNGVVDQFPPPRVRPPAKKIEVSAAVITRNGKVFIQQRPKKGLMGGLWEFPGGKRRPKETEEQCLKREIREELGIPVVIAKKLMTIRHSYTQFRVTLNVFWCPWQSGRIRATQCEQWKWVRYADLNDYTFPAANVKIVQTLMSNGGQWKS
ncbi:MAG: A/G-specific adenine glycosylase [Nitrospinaceae bacterium]|nr:A/G-specific adenine glycosylase [Nitrospinaceae bacterium]NIR53519.1 A/G-specific adenine glycosylase [Nitrospinaceae bacterium]NIS83918.1 A/G-specific adenine glycosylase [Nitrospinaceae bacterium]NIT80726.1 A/G-specific adenine glycosylase [Nitrospinaceae bacterium]NIU43035.1 A/G-specific adenine glycosylase [Nitrospinaceae bacterium]